MNTAASGSLSGNKISTYQSNIANDKTDLTFYSKGQLRKHIDLLEMEADMKQRKYQEGAGVYEKEIIKLRKEKEELEMKYDKLLDQALNIQLEELKTLKQQINPFMKIAV
jgi:hypothetical protein